MRNVPHSLRHLNTSSPVDGAVSGLGGLEGCIPLVGRF